MGWVFAFIGWLILCFVVGYGAQKRGRSFGGYFALSLFLSPLIGIIILLVLGETDEVKKEQVVQQINLNESIVKERQGDIKKCPFCAEEIKKEAIVCRFCGRDMPKEKIVDIEIKTENNNNVSSVDENRNMEIEQLEKLFEATLDENEKGNIAKKLYDLGKMYYWRFIPRDKK